MKVVHCYNFLLSSHPRVAAQRNRALPVPSVTPTVALRCAPIDTTKALTFLHQCFISICLIASCLAFL